MVVSESSPSVPGLAAPASPVALSTLDTAPLDNPIWNSLITENARFALGGHLARRFPPAIGPLAGMSDISAASYEALRDLAGHGGTVALFLQEQPAPPPGWKMVRDGTLHQMICLTPELPDPATLAPEPGSEIVQLNADDVPAMVELARLTEPGPFGDRTHELGTFFGIRSQGRLVAMAGERLRFSQFVEVSAVCTHPDARGKGYGSALTTTMARHIRSNGKTPILHLFAANQQAFRVYASLGFTVRRSLELAILKNEF